MRKVLSSLTISLIFSFKAFVQSHASFLPQLAVFAIVKAILEAIRFQNSFANTPYYYFDLLLIHLCQLIEKMLIFDHSLA